MAAKHMIIRRIVIPVITMALLISQMTGCAAVRAVDMVEASASNTEIVLEYSEPNYEEIGSEVSDGAKEVESIAKVMIRTLFGEALKAEYQKAFDTYNTVDSILQKMKDTYTAATDKENVVVVPVIGDETLQDELKAIEEAAESLGKKVPRDNDERYIMWREGAEESLLEQAQAAYDEWLAEQKAAEAAKKAEEEAKAKAEAEAKAKAEAEAAAQQQQPSGGGSSSGGSSSGGSSGGSTGGGYTPPAQDYTPPAPQPEPEPPAQDYTPPAPQPEPEPPAQDYTPPAQDNGGGWTGGNDSILGGFVDSDTGDAIIG